ncbi:MAG: DUF1015 domain-containing protein [Thermoleophilia bacterium]
MPVAPAHNFVKKSSEVLAFRGLRYNPDLVSDLSRVVAPPYDIISPARQHYYHEKHPLNAIRLDFGLSLPGDDEKNNRYTRASAQLKEWLRAEILVPEPKPSIYCLREEYNSENGATAIRDGFIAMVRLTDFSEGRVLPHEETALGPKEDRLKLMESTEANLSPIFCIYSDPGGIISETLKPAYETSPDVQLIDDADTRHSLWIVSNDDACAGISRALAERTLYVADGHHRYETALAYRDARRAKDGPGPDQPYDYMMIYLSSMEEAGRSIFPIHRFVSGLTWETMERLSSSLQEYFEIKEVPGKGTDRQQKMISMMNEQPADRNSFGIYLPAPDSYQILTALKPRPVISAEKTARSAAYRSLDVAVLDRVILDDVLGVSPEGSNADAKVRFVERTDKALEETSRPGFQVAFFVNPTSMEEIRAVSEAGEKMPQKSTYFYPKPLTGMVFRSYLY